MDQKEHWNKVYQKYSPDRVSWYRPHLERSLDLLARVKLPRNASIIDVGGGASTFADDLLDRGFERVTVVDISPAALANSRERLGPRATQVNWLVGDITHIELPEHEFDFWHDRAVFHFLLDADARRRYVEGARRALRPGGHIVVATFGPAGPEQCSGLEVARYSAEELHGQFGGAFRKLESFTELHETPSGSEQEFVYCLCKLS